MKETSLLEHNKTQYDFHTDLDFWRKHNERHQSDTVFNNQEIKLGDLLLKHPNTRSLAIDIGSGAGWLSSKLAEHFTKVIGIEPSDKAVGIAKELYKDIKNVEFIHGFSEDIFPSIQLNDKPVLFVTCSVFQHLEDEYVSQILSWINTNAPSGSILSFQELWGNDQHTEMHHVRTQEWWSKNLSEWSLHFHGPVVLPNTCKGIHGLKNT